jgi:hypothetical protein
MVLKFYIYRHFTVFVFALLILSGCMKATSDTKQKTFPLPKINFTPHTYIIYKTDKPLNIDGKLDERTWQKADWTNDFVNITGDSTNPPPQQTRAKLLWDKDYLYIGIQLKEKNIWATMTKHDAPLYLENACEVFIDPDEDTQHYLEFGMNALSTTYDLLLPKPYRDGGHPISAYNIRGLKAEVSVDGSINDPNSDDVQWTAEIAFPIKALKELNLLNDQLPPKAGDQWRLQLARAERQLVVRRNKYKMKKDPKTGRPLPSRYSSWAPQGLVNLHYPEMWGIVQFSDVIAGQRKGTFKKPEDEQIKWALRNVYYQLKQYRLNNGLYTGELSELKLDKIKKQNPNFSPALHATENTFIASYPGFQKNVIWYINQDGKIWSRKN